MRLVNLIGGVALALSTLTTTSAFAGVVTSLPGGTAETMPITNYFGSGPVTFGADNLTWTSSWAYSVEGFNEGYGFGSNGWAGGAAMIGLNAPVGTMDVTFSKPVSGVVADINWAESNDSGGQPITLTAYNASNQAVDTITFDSGNGSNLVAPGVWGFKEATAGISRIEFSNGYIGARDFSVLAGGVPEPSTWTMLIVGVAMIGFAARRRPAGAALAA